MVLLRPMRGGRRGLAEVLTRTTEMSHLEALAAVRATVGVMTAWLASGRPLYLRGLGTFTATLRAAQERGHPDDPIQTRVPERATVRFRPSPELQVRLYHQLKKRGDAGA